VVDLWGGYADLGQRRSWEAGSLVQPYSVSKPFAAVCALRLVQAGQLDLDAPVQRYWPEFCASATVRHVLSHQAGRPALYRRAVANPPGAQDGAVVNSAACRAAKIPAVNGHGTAAAVAGFYHALATGQLLSPGMLAEAVTPQCTGPDRVFGDDNTWGLGLGISGDGYGMGGLGGNYGGTSTQGGYSIGFVTGSAGSYDRIGKLENTLRNCLGLAPSQPPATRLRAANPTRPAPDSLRQNARRPRHPPDRVQNDSYAHQPPLSCDPG
jgi:Beta-lactamase